MSTETLSPTVIPTCADVIERIGIRSDLPMRRRQDLASAVRRFCRLQSRGPHDIPADPAGLRHQLAQMSPITAGLSRGEVERKVWRDNDFLLPGKLLKMSPLVDGQSAVSTLRKWGQGAVLGGQDYDHDLWDRRIE